MAPVKRIPQLAYSTKRRARQGALALRQVQSKIITPTQYNAIVNQLNAEQTKTNARAKTEAVPAAAAEPVARNTVTMVPAPSTKRLLTLTYSYQYKYNNDKKSTRRTLNGEKHITVAPGQDPTAAVEKWKAKFVLEIDTASPSQRISDVNWAITSLIDVAPATTNKKVILMRAATALDLDGRPLQTWDGKTGTCVYDFLVWRYGKVKGCVGVATYENLDTIFNDDSPHNNWRIHISDQVRESLTGNARVDGVCISQLIRFCDQAGVNMYAMDERETIIHSHHPRVLNKNAPPLIFQVKDNHFFAILDRNMSISRIGKRKTALNNAGAAKAEEEPKPDLKVEVLMPGCVETSVATMIDKMKEVGKQVYPFKNIQMTENGLRGFKLDDVQYVFDEDKSVEAGRKIAELNGVPYTGGTSFSHLFKLLEENEYKEKSVLNPMMFDLLTAEGVKWRQHFGASERITDLSGLLCVDITKCYTSIIQSPKSEWLQFGFNDTFVPYTGGPIHPGLYYVKTNDLTLLHSDNIYSHTIVRKAIAEGIPLEIVSVCLPTRKSLAKNYFDKLLAAIDVLCKGDADLKKTLTNVITGLYGKHKTDKYVCRMNSDAAVVWDDFTEPEFHNNKTFMYRVDEIYVYGYVQETTQVENNIPMYIQILDQSNIALYEMVKRSGGTCVWRKTDCALIRGGSLTFNRRPLPGMYREQDPPHLNDDGILTMERPAAERAVHLNTLPLPWVCYPEITNSSQVDEVYALLMEKRALCNVSRAGTGKSFNILGLETKFLAEHPEGLVKKIAFTNKACLNIGGTTIHKFLKIDKTGRLNLDWLKSIRDRAVLIMIDEVSMIGAFLWRRLVELKQALPNAFFVLCGDYRQVPPVEDLVKEIDYFDAPGMKFLSNNNRIEFKVRQRYDEALWDFAENVWEHNTTDFSKVDTENGDDITPEYLDGKNVISYYNETRKSINAMMNEYKSAQAEDVIPVPYELKEDETAKTAKQQDAILFVGVPIIASVNKKGEEEELLFANNECFLITDLDDEYFTAVSERPDGEWSIKIAISEFHQFFVLNYCATVHKSQGATIDNDIVIFNYERMSKNLKYTAITRAKKLSQISIIL